MTTTEPATVYLGIVPRGTLTAPGAWVDIDLGDLTAEAAILQLRDIWTQRGCNSGSPDLGDTEWPQKAHVGPHRKPGRPPLHVRNEFVGVWWGRWYRVRMRAGHRLGWCFPRGIPVEPGLVYCDWCGLSGHRPPPLREMEAAMRDELAKRERRTNGQ